MPARPDRSPGPAIRFGSLVGTARDAAVPIVRASFVGYYRWHAKRTLREADCVRGAYVGPELVGVAMLDRLTSDVGYVFYLAVVPNYRGQGVGAGLLDDALAGFRSAGLRVAYGVVEPENGPSLGLFRSRGFRNVERKERSYLDGGLGAWGLRSKMRIVGDELLLGLRLDSPSGAPSTGVAGVGHASAAPSRAGGRRDRAS